MCRRPLLGGPVHKLGANSEGRRRLKVRSQAVGAKATAFKLIQVSIVYIRCLKLIQVSIVYMLSICCLYAVYNMLSICCLYVVYALRLQSAVYMLLNTLRPEPQLKSPRWYTREGLRPLPPTPRKSCSRQVPGEALESVLRSPVAAEAVRRPRESHVGAGTRGVGTPEIRLLESNDAPESELRGRKSSRTDLGVLPRERKCPPGNVEGVKREPLESPEAKVVIIAESSSKILGPPGAYGDLSLIHI